MIVSIRDIQNKGATDIEKAKYEYITQVKRGLQDIIEIGYRLVEKNYDNTTKPDKLKNIYGSELKTLCRESAAFHVAKNLKELQTPYQISPPGISKYFKCHLLDVSKIKNTDELYQKIRAGLKVRPRGFIYSPKSKLQNFSYYIKMPDSDKIMTCGITTDYIMQDAKKTSKDQIRAMIFDYRQGYIFVNNMQAKNVVHPFLRDIEGMDYSKIPDASGKFHVLEMVDICKKYGQGHLTYYWPKHEQGQPDQPATQKLSYVKLFKPWGWILGSGEYIDEINEITRQREEEIKEEIKLLILKVLLLSLGITFVMILLSVFCASTISRPISKLIKTMRAVKTDELSNVTISLKGCQEIRDLGAIFNKMLRSINESIRTIRETTASKQHLESELKIAEDIQSMILPSLAPITPHANEFEIAADILPGKPVGADLYDYFFIDDDHFCFALGDVSDKGVSASLFMTVTRTILRAKAVRGLSSGEIITEMNKSLCTNNEKSMYVRFFLAIVNLRSGRLCYTNAGHPPAYLCRQNANLQTLPVTHGIPLGIDSAATYDEENLNLHSQDKIIICTDGFTQATNYQNEQFSPKRLQKSITQSYEFTAQETVKFLFTRAAEYIANAPVSDDLASIVFYYRKNK
jgi:serine phosphatase RsbU (regulator of sigma subunit)